MQRTLLFLGLLGLALGQTFSIGASCTQWDASCLSTLTFEGTAGIPTSYTFDQFNAILLGQFQAQTGDTQGRVFTGTFNIGAGYSIGSFDHHIFDIGGVDGHLPYELFAVSQGDNWVSGALLPAAVPYWNGTYNTIYDGLTEGIYAGGGLLPGTTAADLRARVPLQSDNVTADVETPDQGANLNNYFNCIGGLQAAIASNTPNVNIVSPGVSTNGLELDCGNGPSPYFLFLTGAQLSANQWWQTDNCDPNGFWYITVDQGSSEVDIQGGDFPALSGRVLYNFIGSGPIYVETEVRGSIFASGADVYQLGGNIRGKVVALDYFGGATPAGVVSNGASQISRECDNDTIVDYYTALGGLPAPTNTPSKRSSSTTVEVTGFSGFIVGDTVTIGTDTTTITGLFTQNGNDYMQFTPALSKTYSAGTVIVGSADLSQDRTQVIADLGSSASHLSIALLGVFAALFAALF